jgi:predicted nucleic acid-binding protein
MQALQAQPSTLTVRNLDEAVKTALRVRAAHNGRSMEAEARAILGEALLGPGGVVSPLGTRIRARFAGLGADALELPARRRSGRMIVLDTNVVSELMRRRPHEDVLGWVDAHDPRTLAITAITAAELLHGVERLPRGARAYRLADAVHDLLTEDFAGRVLPFDGAAAIHYGSLVAARERAGRPISVADGQIAAICRHHDALLATRNLRDFDGTDVGLLDPWAQPVG